MSGVIGNKISIAIIGGLLLSPLSAAWSFDLTAALSAARERDSQWLTAQAQYRQAQEKIPQARAQLLPNASVTANAMHDDQKTHYPDAGVTTSGGFSTHQTSLNLKVPLWRQQDWSGLSEAEQQVEQAQWEMFAAEADLVRRLAQAYADVLTAQETLAQSRSLHSAYAFQLEQAQARFEHGNATVVDADQARAKADQAAADAIEAGNTLAIKRSALAELIGDLLGDPQPLLPEYRPMKLAPSTLTEWQQLALQNSASYRAKIKATEAADTEINKQRAAFLPTLDLVGTYAKNGVGNSALMGQTGTVVQQSQIGLQVSLPLYSGGATNSAIRQATAAFAQAQDDQAKTRGQLTTAITQAYLGVVNGGTAIDARSQAVKSAQTALQSAQKGLAHGMKTQLDVLNAAQQLASAQKDFTKTQLDTLVSEVTLRATAGVITQQELTQLNAYFSLSGASGTFPASEKNKLAGLQSAVQSSAAVKHSFRELSAMVTTPATLLELIKNCKFALDNNLLIQDDFYTEETIKHFFGGQTVSWRSHDSKNKVATVRGFGEMAQPYMVGDQNMAVQFQIGKTIESNGKGQGSLSIRFIASNQDIAFERIESVFGSEWEPNPYITPPHEKIIHAATNPHGNDRIKYLFDDEVTHRLAAMEFSADGALYNIDFVEEGFQ